MKLEYYFGETNVSFGEDYIYEIDSEQMENAFVDIQAGWVAYALRRALNKEETKLVKETLRIVAKDNDGLVNDFCKANEDEIKKYFENDAYGEWKYE